MENTSEATQLRERSRQLAALASKLAVKKWRAEKRRATLTLDQLRALLSYDADTGQFTWRVRRHAYGGYVNSGDIAGTLKTGKGGGYILIVVDQHNFRAHRLAWWFMTGEQPPNGIDVEHNDTNRANNKWHNLRLATRSQNNYNMKRRRDNTSGVKGVHRIAGASSKSAWFARIKADKKIIHLGSFATLEEATEARRQAEIKHHGEFRYQPIGAS